MHPSYAGTRRAYRGFTLVEMLIVMTVAIALAGMGMAWYGSETERQNRAQAISDQAADMSTIAAALEAYLATKPATVPADGTAVTLSSEVLEDAGFLADRFAVRSNDNADVTARSPLGQAYIIKARQVAGKYVGVVYTLGTPSIEQLGVMGMKATEEAYKEHHTAVMRRVKAVHYGAAGLVLHGQTATNSAVSGFQFDMLPFEPSAFVNSNAAVFAGVNELKAMPAINITVDESGGGPGSGTGGEISTDGRACYLNTTTGECNAGYEKVWGYTACERWGPQFNDEPPSTSVTIGGNTILIEKTLKAAGSDQLNLPKKTVKEYWQQGMEYGTSSSDSFCPTGYRHYELVCGSGSTQLGKWCQSKDQWRDYAPGQECSQSNTASTNALYSGGLVDRVSPAEAIGKSGISPDYGGTFNLSPARVSASVKMRDLAPCAASTYAVSRPVYRYTEGSKWFEYSVPAPGVAAREASYSERITGAGVDVTTTCVRRVLTSAASFSFGPVTAINACPNVASMPDYSGLKPVQLFEYATPAADRKKFAYCCAPRN